MRHFSGSETAATTAVVTLFLLLSLNGKTAASRKNSLADICRNATNNTWNSDGFVCAVEFSHFYVSCNKTDNSACFLRCPENTRCSMPSGDFVNYNPCMGFSRCCGNAVAEIALSEQCDGGEGCAANCMCKEGYFPNDDDPLNPFCSLCGNGVVDEGEECDGTEGCLPSCRCGGDYTPSDGICIYANNTNVTLEDICNDRTICEKDSGYVCLSQGSPQYLRCHLEERVATMMSCAAGTSCRAPEGVFQLMNPCLSDESSYAADQYFPNQTAAMDELLRSSPCIERDPTTSLITRSVAPITDDPNSLCTIYNMTGFYCSRTVSETESAISYVMCANGIGEKMECPIGEICSADGFTQENPCAQLPPGTSVCGDGILDTNEECERNGLGCDTSTCKCKSGYYPSVPQKTNCLLNYTMACIYANNGTVDIPTYFCPVEYSIDANSSEYIKCVNGVPMRETCRTNEFCSERGFYDDYPCVDVSPKCGNGVVEVGEECEISGNGCNNNTCKCKEGYHPTDPATTSCVGDVSTRVTYNYTQVCEEFGTAGYFCAALFDDPECRRVNSSVFVQCGERGRCAGVLTCAPGTYCSAPGFTISTPCTHRNYCGNGRVDGNEECEMGGLGCNNESCTCEAGYSPKTPPEVDCALNPISLQCLNRGQNGTVTTTICPEDDDTMFVVCTGNNALSSYKMNCPPGTACINKTKVETTNPCELA